jgi:hypothetical protein
VRLAPDASLPLRYVARDDVSVAAVVMQVEVDGKAIAPRPLTAPAAVPGKPGIWEGAASLDLASLTLGDAKTVTVKLRASDNLPPDLRGPQAGESDPLVIVLDRQAQPLAKQSLDAQEARIRQTLQKAAEQLERAKQTSSDKPAQLADKAAVPEDALRELQQIRDDAGAAGTALDDLARQAEGSAFDRMAEAIRDVPRQDVEPALKDAQMIELVNKPAERVEHAEAMDRHLGQALADVKEALRDLDALDKEVDRLAEMSDMAQRQAQLAGEMQQQQAQNAEAKPDASWQQRQQGVAADAAALARQDAAAQAPSAAAQEQARALAAEIGDLAARQGQLSEALAAAAPAAAAKVAAQQQAIADAAGELAAEAGKLAQAAGSPAPQSAGAPEAANPAAQAAGQMAQAAGKAQQAASSLSGSPQQAGQPSSAAAAKQQMGGAQQAMQQAAQSLAQMAGNTPPAAPASPGGSQPPPGAAALANAASQAAQAAQASQASQAAQSAQASAASLAQAVGAAQKSLGMSPGMPGMPSSLPGQSGGGNMGAAPDGAAEISELGGAGADWFRTAGKLQSDAENAAVENAPPEYRDLVARYFRELARQGEKTEK